MSGAEISPDRAAVPALSVVRCPLTAGARYARVDGCWQSGIAGAPFVACVDFRGGVISNQDHGESWPTQSSRIEGVALCSYVAPEPRCDAATVDDLSRHG